MLSHLVIKNFAIIDHTEIEFGTELTVLTGETGAGKSIIVNALNLLLGGRANAEIIRTGEESAVVEGIFELDDSSDVDAILDGHGLPECEGQLLIRRIVARTGRNKVFVNGSITTLSALGEITKGLVDLSGQHEHVSLLDVDRHLDILDAYGKSKTLRAEMASTYQAMANIKQKISTLKTDIQERLNRIDYLKFQLEEIEKAELVAGEKESAAEEVATLKHASKIEEATQRAVSLCNEQEGSISELLSEAANVVNGLSAIIPDAKTQHDRLQEAKIIVEDVVHDLAKISQTVDDDPQRIDHLIERLEIIKHLERKHGGDIPHILAYAESMSVELETLENAEAQTAELESALEKATAKATNVAEKLRKKRQTAAKKLTTAVEKELDDLKMSGTKFVVSFSESSLSKKGHDTVEFLVSPNVGEEPKPIVKIASGGELSRIMLALKTVHTERDTVATYIFDEVDTGIGGETADRVGDKLAKTAANHQVLCITHLPQIASRATHHMVVSKHEVEGRTISSIDLLTSDERIEEIARMLGGTRVSDKTREAARDLLSAS